MEWFVNAFWGYIGVVVAQLVLFVLLPIAVLMLIGLPRFIRQKRCHHVEYFETGACDAVCRSCRKNLGFIGRVREERMRREIGP